MKIDARTLSAEAQEVLRKRTVAAVLGGMRQNKAAEVFGVTECAVSRWMTAYRSAKGLSGLDKKKRGPKKSPAKLKGWQAAAICNIIRDRHPEQLKLPFALWTARSIRDLIRQKFKVDLSVRSVRRYLNNWGFTPQKPQRVAYEKSPVETKRWKQKRYPAIRALAKREKALIYWADEMGLRSDHQVGRSYSPKGVTPTRAGTGKRFSCNMISAITNRDDLSFMIFKERFSATVFIDFMKRLARQAKKQKVFLIIDGHPVHRSEAVRGWVKANHEKIRVYYLPPYSPELNPDERVNNDVKQTVGQKTIRNLDEMEHGILSHMRKRKRNRKQVKKYFNDPAVEYAA
jgi:transposase